MLHIYDTSNIDLQRRMEYSEATFYKDIVVTNEPFAEYCLLTAWLSFGPNQIVDIYSKEYQKVQYLVETILELLPILEF